jgi:uncharacterized protein RhaS with RHS repeats
MQPLRGRLVNRYYDPATGQFGSVDPLVAQTQSPHSYAGDDPVNATDPLGRTASPSFLAFCASSAAAQAYCHSLELKVEAATTVSAPIPAVTINWLGLDITISGNVQVSASDASTPVVLNTDGSVDVTSGSINAHFSSEGVETDILTSQGSSVTLSNGDITLTKSYTQSEASGTVTAQITATLSAGPESPSGGGIDLPGDLSNWGLDFLKAAGGVAKAVGEGCVDDPFACAGG